MVWQEKLRNLCDDRTLAKVSAKLGFSKNRMYVIVQEGQCPNAVDAVRICRYLGTTVEAIFGDDAARPPVKPLDRSRDAAAVKKAAIEAAQTDRAVRAGRERKAAGRRGRKTG